MDRITEKQLEAMVERINVRTGNPVRPWCTDDPHNLRANIGNYHLDFAYGGVSLVQMIGESGGERTIIGRGTKRELYNSICAYLDGIEIKTVESMR